MKTFALTVCALFAALTDARSIDIPTLGGRVNDNAGLLTEMERGQLESKLEAFENETSNQIVLLTVKSFQGETPQVFGTKVFKAWKLGQKDKNNGILMTFSMGDRKFRIDVGYGLEAVVPDALAFSIVRNEIAPLTKQNKFYAGFDRGIDAIIKATKGEYKNEKAGEKAAGEIGVSTIIWGLIALVVIIIVSLAADPPESLIVSAVIGGVYGFLQWPLLFTWAIVSIICGVFLSLLVTGLKSASGGGGYSSGDSSFFSFGGGGGGDSGGGFSGGGGDSGGGGGGGDA